MKKKCIISFVFWGMVLPLTASAAVMWLWNGLMPDLFGVPCVTFRQALGLLFLCHILLGGFILGFLFFAGLAHSVFHGYGGGRAHEHWMRMNAEERKKFVDRMEERRRQYGFGHPFGGEKACEEKDGDEMQDHRK